MIASSSATDWNGREFYLGDDLLVARENCGELFVLNNTARAIWHAWRKQLSTHEISTLLAEKYCVPADLAQQDVRATITEWKKGGLIGETPKQTSNLLSDRRVLHDEINQNLTAIPSVTWFSECSYQLYDFSICIRFENITAEKAINALFAHLKVDDTHEANTTFDILQKDNSYTLYKSRELILSNVSIDALVIGVLYETIQAVCSQTDHLIIIHAAAVANGDECIVFPGCGGSGKSTLTASLLHSGFTYLSDDLVPLDRKTQRAIPLPISPNVKKGSLSIVEGLFGSLEHFRKYKLPNKEAWYLRTSDYNLNWARNCYPVKYLVFPRYIPGAPTQLSPLSPAGALQGIFNANSVCKTPTDLSCISSLVDWIDKVPAFNLTYGSLDQATREIKSLFFSN